MLLVSGGKVSIVDADGLWAKGIFETTAAVRKRFGARARSLVIGPAGENLVPFACIMHEAPHALGRAGLGAVMGSKLLTAVVMAPHAGDAALADPSRMKLLVKELTPRINAYLMSQVLRDFGSPGNLEGHMYTGDVPIKNWTSNFSEEMAEALTGSTLTERFLTRTGTCAYCAVACKRVVRVDDGPFAIPEGPGRNTRRWSRSGASSARPTWRRPVRPEGCATTSAWTPSRPGPPSPGQWRPSSGAICPRRIPAASRSSGAT
jgi:aldehyde:ferredoxin oxidoreductase